jgi:crotonobetaine/carnitine-CoA ligase
MDVWDLIELRGSRTADHPFVTWQPFDQDPRTVSYGEMRRWAAAFGSGLQARGIRPGDRVLINLDNCLEFLVAWFGCASTGAVAVTTNPRSSAEELRYYAEQSHAKGAITQPAHLGRMTDASTLPWLVCTDHDGGVITNRQIDDPFTAFLGDPAGLRRAHSDPFDPMAVQYTSGTTARPKGVVWSHANALWAARVSSAHEDLRPSDAHLVYLPLFHTNALSYSVLASLWVGARMVLMPKWSASRFWDVALGHQCTWVSLIGPSLRLLAKEQPPAASLFRLAGAPVCDVQLHPNLNGLKTIGWWAMTETVSHPIIGDVHLPNRPFSMGRPAPEYQIAIVRPDGSPVHLEETGELLVKGRPGVSMFSGYLEDPDQTAAAFNDDGWFATGDLVTPMADGHIVFADRLKDMLKVGGENVGASEIERVILEVPTVTEVAVVGRRHDFLDEVPVAFIVTPHGHPKDVAATALAKCAQLLADFKVPHEVHVVQDLPHLTLHKVNKARLRTAAASAGPMEGLVVRWTHHASAKITPTN